MDNNYIAGFFDADGYITLIKPKKNQEHQPCVGFTNTVRSILEDIQAFILKEYGIVGFISKKKALKINHNIGYDLKFRGFEKCFILLINLPIRHPKKQRRFKALEEIRTLTPRNGKYKQDVLKKRRELCEAFRLIK